MLDKAGAVPGHDRRGPPRGTEGGEGTRALSSAARSQATAPDGKRADVVALCMRPEGASTKELIAATGWKGCPWAWTIGTNKNRTGLADRYGYGFHKAKVGDETRYFLTPAPAAVTTLRG